MTTAALCKLERNQFLQIRIICVGKIKEKFYRDAIAEYMKRLTRYAKILVEECADEKTPEDASPAERTRILDREGERILSKIRDRDYVIALAIKGKTLTSEQFAEMLGRHMQSGTGTIDFVIGGSLGLSEEVLRRADLALSFSDFTFPHQLMRVILAEQIYRAFRILSGAPYHK